MKALAVHVVGDGAVGTTIAFSLAPVAKVFLYGRHGVIEGQRALLMSTSQRTTHLFTSPGRDHEQPGLFIFAVKAYDFTKASQQYAPSIPVGSVVLVVCNGYIDDELTAMQTSIGKGIQWFRGVVLFGATREEPTTFKVHSPHPRVLFDTQAPQEVRQLLQSSGLFAASPDILRDIQLKLFANLVLNTLTGALNLSRNADVLKYPQELSALSIEAFRLLESLYGSQMRVQEQACENYLKTIIEATSENTNSMVVDLRSRKQTEIQYLAGLASNQRGFPTFSRLYAQILASTHYP